MYKLVVIAGKLRGQEFELENGENILGRSDECSLVLDINGVSKKHFSITVTDDVAYIQDLDSSNGTFVNGRIIKRATVKNADKITVPDTVLQVVYVEEKKVIIHKQVIDDDEDDEDYITGGDIPQAPLAKVIWFFKYKVMPVLHGINEEYEWKILFSILLVIFVLVTITLTIFPVLQDSKNILLSETAKRGAHYAEEISRINYKALESRQLDLIDTAFLNTEDGVESYELYDLEGRIVSPRTRLNEYISDPFSIRVREWAMKTKNENSNLVFKKILKDEIIGIGKKIVAYSARTASFEPVGIISIRFAPRSLQIEAAKSSAAYAEALMTSFIVCVIFFALVYYLTVRPIEELKYQLEEALRGKRKNLESRYMMVELDPLRNSINSVLSKMRELQNEELDTEFDDDESDEPYVSTLNEFLLGSSGSAMVLNSEKNLSHMNLEAEDLTGIRESSSIGLNILDICREKGFAGTLVELCDDSANNSGMNQNTDYELQGRSHTIHVTALIGKDGFAKAYYITFLEEG